MMMVGSPSRLERTPLIAGSLVAIGVFLGTAAAAWCFHADISAAAMATLCTGIVLALLIVITVRGDDVPRNKPRDGRP